MRGQALHLDVTAPWSCCWNTGCRLKPCSLSALPDNAALVRHGADETSATTEGGSLFCMARIRLKLTVWKPPAAAIVSAVPKQQDACSLLLMWPIAVAVLHDWASHPCLMTPLQLVVQCTDVSDTRLLM